MSNVNLTVYAGPDASMEGRGYVREGTTWALIDLGAMHVVASGTDELGTLERWADVLRTAVAQARQAQQDEDLADLAVIA